MPSLRTIAVLVLALTLAPAGAQISSIVSMTVPSTQMTFDAMPLGAVTVADINNFYGVNIVDITPVAPLAADGTYNTNPQLGRALGFAPGMTGTLVLVDPPSGLFGGSNGYRIDLGVPSTEIGLSIGDWAGSKDVFFYSGATQLGMSTVSGAAPATVQFYQSAVPFDAVEITGAPNWVLPEIWLQSGLGCSLTTPASPAAGDISLDFDVFGAMSMAVNATFEYSTDSGATWNPCTAAPTSPVPNPAIGIPPAMDTFVWDSVADSVGVTALVAGVLVQTTISDPLAMMPGVCQTMPFDVDNVVPPSCTLTGPAGTASADVSLDIDLTLPNSPSADVVFEYSLDAGATWLPCSPGATSPLPNPALGVPAGPGSFLWDSRLDMVGDVALQPGVIVQATADDGVVLVQAVCATAPFDVDNTSLCTTLCGDCDLNAAGPDVLDALTGAQIAAGLTMPSLAQQGCCDVDSSGTITVIDALGMAQAAAGLPVSLTCP